MKTPVKFELAKLLKEKGFDYHSLYNDFANEYDYFNRSVQGRLHVSDFPEDKFPDENIWIPVPYIHQVVMWLYENFGIWISVDTDINGRFRYILRKYNNIDRAWEVKNNISVSEYFKSPTESYEAAIEYCLTNLI